MDAKLNDIGSKLQDTKELEKQQGLGLRDRLEAWDKSLKDMHRCCLHPQAMSASISSPSMRKMPRQPTLF